MKIENRKVQAIIDLDTGFIGFTEIIHNKEIEYYFEESPVEFKKAFVKRLEPIFGKRIQSNFKICRKNENMKYVSKYLRDKSKSG